MANKETLDPQWFETYWPPFRRHVHELLVWGYKDSRDKIKEDLEEEEITGFISEAIQDRLEAPDYPGWCENYALKENNPVPGKNLTGKRRKVPDFIFELTKGTRPKYIFEAKRLRFHRNFREKYYFDKGLKRFLRGEYAANYLEAGMIGYVQYDTCAAWVERLKHYIQGDRSLHLKASPQDASILDEIPQEWLSSHIRASGNEIVLYHIALNCFSEECTSEIERVDKREEGQP